MALVFALILGARWDGVRAGLAGWGLALLLALGPYGLGTTGLLTSQLSALFLAADVLAIIWGALFLHAVMEDAAAFRSVAHAAGAFRARPVLGAATLGWALATLLQGVAGFGVPVAVLAPVLVGLGLSPMAAVILPSLGHGWAVTFGSIGNALQAMLNVTGLPVEVVALPSALLAAWAGLGCGMAALGLCCGWRALRAEAVPILGMAAVMGVVQVGMAGTRFWPLASLGSGLAGLAWGLACLLVARRPAPSHASAAPAAEAYDGAAQPGPFLKAMAPYGLLWLVVTAARLPLVTSWADRLAWRLPLSASVTRLGWENPARSTVAMHPLLGTGPLVLLCALLALLWYRRQGMGSGRLIGPVRRTLLRAWRPSLAILLLVGMGELMVGSGMTQALAKAAADALGPAFVWTVPWIGALGALITGTNTNSNLLFARMELEAARHLALDVGTVMALQNVGAAVTSVLSPAKIMVGLSTVGMAGAEGTVMRRLAGPAFLIVGLVSLLALL